jgi:chemotaxis protein MotB
MVTLLLVLFIVLFSISVVNTSKFISLRTSLASAFGSGQKSLLDGGTGLNENDAEGTGQQLVMPGVPVLGQRIAVPSSARTAAAQSAQSAQAASAGQSSTAPNGATASAASQSQDELNNFARIERIIQAALDRQGMSGAVRFAIDHRGLVITVITDDLVFPGNSATLLAGGQRILAVIAPPLRSVPNSIEVDGYTNQVNVSTDPYPSGWELSSARASAVVRYLISAGVDETHLSAVGYSDQHPLYPPSDPRAVTLNRRVEVVVRSSTGTAAAVSTSATNGTTP